MSHAKHTPGPWAVHAHHAYVVPAGHERRYIGFAEDDEKDLRDFAQAICAIRWPDRHRPEAEAKANARLIAAAPLMLEALENLENDDGLRMPDSAWELVQEAVEAATGRRKPSAAEMRGEL